MNILNLLSPGFPFDLVIPSAPAEFTISWSGTTNLGLTWVGASNRVLNWTGQTTMEVAWS